MKSSTLDYMDCIPQVSYAKISYEKDFRIAFLESKGDEFQRLFEKLMKKVYPNDFIPCRPWGKDGDCKNDGYLRSQRKLFQVYAPNEIKKEEAIRKINEDFVGAKNHWEEYFDKWIFAEFFLVENIRSGCRGVSDRFPLNRDGMVSLNGFALRRGRNRGRVLSGFGLCCHSIKILSFRW